MNKPIEMIALDIDGTLLDSIGNISNNTNLKLKELVKKGKYVVLATGRPNKSAASIKKKLSLNLPIISYNGSTVELQEGEKILENKISVKDAIEIIRYGEELGLHIKVYIDDIMYLEKDSKFSKIFADYHNIEYKVVGKLSEFVKKDVNMIVFVYKELPKDDVDNIFKEMHITTARSTPYVVEFMAKGSTKGQALKLLADHLDIEKNNVLAVGNALNDLEMLEYARIGIAMKNSDINLLKVWDVISKYSNDEDGIYQIIKDL